MATKKTMFEPIPAQIFDKSPRSLRRQMFGDLKRDSQIESLIRFEGPVEVVTSKFLFGDEQSFPFHMLTSTPVTGIPHA